MVVLRRKPYLHECSSECVYILISLLVPRKAACMAMLLTVESSKNLE